MLNNRQLFLRHMAPTSGFPLMLEIERSEGVYLIDSQGKKMMDLISGIGVSNIGHRHPNVLKAIQEQLDKYLHTMVYGEYVSFNKNQRIVKLGELPKYDEFIYYFGINFPKQTSYLIAGNTLWIVFSFLLLITVSFFVYALNIILRQKRLSELQKDFINL